MRTSYKPMVSTKTNKVEIRESGMLHATILTEGRAASGGRREVFVPGSVSWPAEAYESLLSTAKPVACVRFRYVMLMEA